MVTTHARIWVFQACALLQFNCNLPAKKRTPMDNSWQLCGVCLVQGFELHKNERRKDSQAIINSLNSEIMWYF